jgi:hypothetical protein
MNTKKLIVFLLWAFLPMVIVGVLMQLSGASSVGLSEDSSSIDPLVVIKGFVLSAGAMFTPLLAVILTQIIFKEPVLKNLGISFKINRWWWLGWLLMPLSAIVVTPANDLLYGPAGLAGFIVLLILDIFLYLYDKYISKEKIFQKAME